MTMLVITLIALWFLAGFLAWGIANAAFMGKYGPPSERGLLLGVFLMGPMGLVATLFCVWNDRMWNGCFWGDRPRKNT